MVENLLKIIPDAFQFLLNDYGFVLTESKKLNAFDDAFVTIKSKCFLVRFVRERRTISVEMASTSLPNKFHEIDFVWELIENRRISDDISLEKLAEFLRNNYNEVQKLFSPEEYEKTEYELRKLKQEWLKRKYPDEYAPR